MSEERVKSTSSILALPKSLLNKLMVKWQLDSFVQVLAVLAVFSLTGSTVVYIRKFLFELLGYSETTPVWLKVVSYIAFIIPSYQILLLVYGFLLGQFSFFWEKEKKMVRRMRKAFRRSK